MNIKEYITSEILKKIARSVYEDVIYVAARDYVLKTDNKYDDAALEFLNDFVNDLLKKENE